MSADTITREQHREAALAHLADADRAPFASDRRAESLYRALLDATLALSAPTSSPSPALTLAAAIESGLAADVDRQVAVSTRTRKPAALKEAAK